MSPEHETVIRERAARYAGLVDQVDDAGNLPGHTSESTATTIGLATASAATDVPVLLAVVDQLRAEAERLRAELARRPRVWRVGDPEPPDAPTVFDVDGDAWTRTIDGGWRSGVWSDSWEGLLADYAPLSEVLPRRP